MSDYELTEEQLAAVTRLDGNVFVAAGAGSGKTGVLTRRFVHAVASGYAGVDEILTITFTKKAAALMMRRIRDDLHAKKSLNPEPGNEELARMASAYRNIERAQISTIDSFYTSILRANALAAGIDPDFSAIDENQAKVIQQEVFAGCLRQLISDQGDDAIEFIIAYDANLSDRLYWIIREAYETLRSMGRPAELPQPAPPDVAEAERGLRGAMAAAREAFDRVEKPTDSQQKFMETLAAYEEAMGLPDPVATLGVIGPELKAGRCSKIQEEANLVIEARQLFVNAVRSRLAGKTLALFSRLLEDFDARYQEEKYRRGCLDFADLSILTRNLLRDNKDVRRQVANRYRLIMVDEFQDTNPLQHEIINLMARDNLFMVGDENQAIYGFRNAEVELFRSEREQARRGDYLIELKDNFRSQAEILSFVDFLFNRRDMLAPGYLQLNPAAEPLPPEECRVEVLVVDGERRKTRDGPPAVDSTITRRAEAWQIAERLQDLFKGDYSPGDAALLVGTRKHADIYRDALTAAGIESYFAVGSSYFGKLELSDVINMFRIIVNPYDDLALLGVLRSPMAGLSDDSLYWLRNHGEPDQKYWGPLWDVLAGAAVHGHLARPESEKLTRFVDGLNGLRDRAGRDSLAGLSRRVIEFNDYAASVAAGRDGRQNLANLLKLTDLAADFEYSWGSDLAEFTEFLAHQKEADVKEVEAPTAEEDVNAVRIMTMHGAKGLEFPLVVLPKLQKTIGSGSNKPVLLIDRTGAGRIGLNYLTGSGAAGSAFDYDELYREEKDKGFQELKRLGYVAMTRAERHLILSGVTPADKPPSTKKEYPHPLDWVRTMLELDRELDDDLTGRELIDDRLQAVVGLQICARPQEVAVRLSQAGGSRSLHTLAALDPRINESLPPSIYVPPEISPTALDAYRACPRRYLLENVLHAGDLFEVSGAAGATSAGEGRLSATEMGTLVHGMLETDLPAPGAGLADITLVDRTAARLFGNSVSLNDADRRRAAALIENLARAPVARELAGAESAGLLRREFSFSTLVGRTILRGQIDALCRQGESTLVVDYKTGKPGEGKTPDEAAGVYRSQLASYALAAGRLHPGAVRVVLVYLGGEEPQQIEQEFSREDLPALEAELASVVDGMADGTFPPLGEPDEYHCRWCAGGGNGAGLC